MEVWVVGFIEQFEWKWASSWKELQNCHKRNYNSEGIFFYCAVVKGGERLVRWNQRIESGNEILM